MQEHAERDDALEGGSSPGTPSGPVGDAFGPIKEHRRIVSLDVLRGFAILGILFVNMQLFAMPMMKGMMPSLSLVGAALSEQVAWSFVHVFCSFKFISLFALLFGAGMMVQSTRAQARGAPFVPMYLRRLAVLGLIGLCHALLLWYGDILLIYAITGLLALPFRKLSSKTLTIVAAALFGVSLLLSATCMSTQLALGGFDAPPAPADEASEQEPSTAIEHMMAAQFQPFSPIWNEGEAQAYREGPLRDAFAYRAVSYAFTIIAFVSSFGWRVWGLFLFGAALLKAGFFGREGAVWQRRMMIFGLGAGLPLEIASTGLFWWQGFSLGWWQLPSQVLHEVGSMALCLGYLGGVCMIVRSGALTRLTRALAHVGRIALTAYLAETVLATSLTYWWGLAWFGKVDRVEQIGLSVAIYAVIVLFGAVWLRWCLVGPVEWLWRSLSYLRLQPLLRRPPNAPGRSGAPGAA
jgi:uncharacterized protein